MVTDRKIVVSANHPSVRRGWQSYPIAENFNTEVKGMTEDPDELEVAKYLLEYIGECEHDISLVKAFGFHMTAEKVADILQDWFLFYTIRRNYVQFDTEV